MKLKNLMLVLCAVLISMTSCRDNERDGEEVDIMETDTDTTTFEEELEEARSDDGIVIAVEGNPELSTFATGLNAWNVGDELEDEKGPFTIFAPSNLAYSTLYEDHDGTAVLRTENEAIIEYHIVPSGMSAEQLRQEIQNANGSYSLRTMGEEELTLSMEGDQVVLKDASGNTARITESDSTEYGYIHIIDKVLLPTDLGVELETNQTQ